VDLVKEWVQQAWAAPAWAAERPPETLAAAAVGLAVERQALTIRLATDRLEQVIQPRMLAASADIPLLQCRKQQTFRLGEVSSVVLELAGPRPVLLATRLLHAAKPSPAISLLWRTQ
jgi:hypothetical protein